MPRLGVPGEMWTFWMTVARNRTCTAWCTIDAISLSCSSGSPELQPAEHLWEFVDELLVNRHFETIEALDQAVSERCVALTQQQEMIRASTLFHWWPRSKDDAPSPMK
jgi:hypothetical protein